MGCGTRATHGRGASLMHVAVVRIVWLRKDVTGLRSAVRQDSEDLSKSTMLRYQDDYPQSHIRLISLGWRYTLRFFFFLLVSILTYAKHDIKPQNLIIFVPIAVMGIKMLCQSLTSQYSRKNISRNHRTPVYLQASFCCGQSWTK